MLKKQYSKTKPLCKVTFTLPLEAAAKAKEVVVLGEFNDWNEQAGVAMKATKEAFQAVVELPAGKNYQFRYLVDGKVWMNDWAADAYLATPFGVENSVVFVDEVLDIQAKKATKHVAPAAKVEKVTTKKVAKTTTPKAKTVAPKAVNIAAKTAPEKAVAKKTVVRVVRKATTKVVADNLTKIEGIGPKIASLLNEAGIVTFNDLSKAKFETLKTILVNAGPRFKMHVPTTWAEQANLADKGDWKALKTLQDELDGGKRK